MRMHVDGHIFKSDPPEEMFYIMSLGSFLFKGSFHPRCLEHVVLLHLIS